MSIPMNYHTSYTWNGEAVQGALAAENLDDLAVGGAGETGRWDPEHMLVAAVETCLANSFLIVAGFSKMPVEAYTSSAEGVLLKEKQGYRFERIIVRPVVTVTEDQMRKVERIMEKAHDVCLITRSLSCPVDVEPEFRTA